MIKKTCLYCSILMTMFIVQEAHSSKLLPEMEVVLSRHMPNGIQTRPAENLRHTFALTPRLVVVYVNNAHRWRSRIYAELNSYIAFKERQADFMSQMSQANPLISLDKVVSIYASPREPGGSGSLTKKQPLEADISEFVILSDLDFTATELLNETPYYSSLLVAGGDSLAEILKSLNIGQADVAMLLFNKGVCEKEVRIPEEVLRYRYGKMALLDLEHFK